MLVAHTIGVSLGLFCWALLYYMHFHNILPARHSLLIAVLGTAQIFLSLDIILTPAQASAWDIIAYLVLTGTAITLSVKGWREIKTGTQTRLKTPNN